MNGRILAIGLAGILGFTSCTQIKGDRNLGQFSYLSVGGDAEGMDLSPEGVKVSNINNSVAFKDASKTVEAMFSAYLTLSGIKYSLGKYYSHEGAALKSSETVKLEELRNAKSATEGQNALEALRINTEAASVVTP